jgi:hypothetical protein
MLIAVEKTSADIKKQDPHPNRGVTMAAIRMINSVSEPELDMNRGRRAQAASGGMVRRLLSTILGYQNSAIGTPRRSIDRELQQYSTSYEW